MFVPVLENVSSVASTNAVDRHHSESHESQKQSHAASALAEIVRYAHPTYNQYYLLLAYIWFWVCMYYCLTIMDFDNKIYTTLH